MRVSQREEKALDLAVIEKSVKLSVVRRAAEEPELSPDPDFSSLPGPAFLQRSFVRKDAQDLVASVNVESYLRRYPRLDPNAAQCHAERLAFRRVPNIFLPFHGPGDRHVPSLSPFIDPLLCGMNEDSRPDGCGKNERDKTNRSSQYDLLPII